MKNELNKTEQENLSQGRRTLVPAVDIFENDAELLFLADVPGVRKDQLQLRLEHGELSLEAPADGYVYRRAFTVPHSIDANRVSAELQHGVLRVTLPKAEAMRTRTIPIKTA